MRRFIANILILFGVLSLSLASYHLWQRNNPQRLSFNLSAVPKTNQFSTVASQPIQIIIPDLGINLPIYPAKTENNKWEATTKGVSYLVSSPVPGEEGNSILYGHNWPNLLGNLKKAKPGEKIQIIYKNGGTKVFQIEYTSIVTPDQSHILNPSDDRRITLYTCTGFLDRKRFVTVALLKE